MIFDSDNKVIIESLEPNEAKAFVKFLESEILRHKDDIYQAVDLIETVKERFSLCW